MKISVKEPHIATGEPADCFRCPITLAAQEATGKQCWTGLTMIKIGDDKYYLPQEAMDFVCDVDDEKDVEPFDFELGEPIQDQTVQDL